MHPHNCKLGDADSDDFPCITSTLITDTGPLRAATRPVTLCRRVEKENHSRSWRARRRARHRTWCFWFRRGARYEGLTLGADSLWQVLSIFCELVREGGMLVASVTACSISVSLCLCCGSCCCDQHDQWGEEREEEIIPRGLSTSLKQHSTPRNCAARKDRPSLHSRCPSASSAFPHSRCSRCFRPDIGRRRSNPLSPEQALRI
jgi:hypothetical protein